MSRLNPGVHFSHHIIKNVSDDCGLKDLPVSLLSTLDSSNADTFSNQLGRARDSRPHQQTTLGKNS